MATQAVAERRCAECSNEAERRNHGWPDMTENCGSNLKSKLFYAVKIRHRAVNVKFDFFVHFLQSIFQFFFSLKRRSEPAFLCEDVLDFPLI